MKYGLFSLIFGILIAHNSNAASYRYLLQECRNRMNENPPQITVEYMYGNLNIDHSKGQSEIADLSKKAGLLENELKTKDFHVAGLTSTTLKSSIQIKTLAQSIEQSSVCVVPTEVTIRLYYDKPTIYILNTLNPNTCRYRLVMRHEQAHLSIEHRNLQEWAKDLKEKISTVVTSRGPKLLSHQEYENIGANITQIMMKEYNQAIKATIEGYRKKSERRQKVLDSPENYHRESALCKQE